jgi:hypothetical protein
MWTSKGNAIFSSRVRRRSLDDQRQPLGFSQHMAFTTCFGTVRWIGTSVRPPKTARTLALSSTARSRCSAPALPNSDRKATCTFGQTSSLVHSAKRRQQVLPLPQFSSCQEMPVRSTKTIPVNAWRLETRGRPPWGEGFGSGGIRGSFCSQTHPERALPYAGPPCFARWPRGYIKTPGFEIASKAGDKMTRRFFL